MTAMEQVATPRYRALVASYRPAGYMLRKVKLRGDNAAYAEFSREIKIHDAIKDRESLFYFLHEVGHVTHGHLRHGTKLPRWREEYEADLFAIKTMRAEGIPVPRDLIAHSKSEARRLVKKCRRDETVDEEVLRWAFGREWRKHV